jgi:hypothetical protein
MELEWSGALEVELILLGKDVDEGLRVLQGEGKVINIHSNIFKYIQALM